MSGMDPGRATAYYALGWREFFEEKIWHSASCAKLCEFLSLLFNLAQGL